MESLKKSSEVAQIAEIPPLAILPHFIVNSRVLTPMQYATGGTLEAAVLAQKHSWAINLGGGFHHACSHEGGGFCVYADISLAILTLNEKYPKLQRFLIVDLDAHQGNGHENDKLSGKFKSLHVAIFDMYNHEIYPQDQRAKSAIDIKVQLPSNTGDKRYLSLLESNLAKAFKKYDPQFVLYNAGTDCLAGDPLGNLNVSEKGIVSRDQMVFQAARDANVPVLMLLSGGYQKSNAVVIADSIQNLDKQFSLLRSKAGSGKSN
eukprot:CAMPEP_0175165230 /NCGR_PEP_ID=MMETSP0087-20121206/26939_1 /TAXON_ID=136419 /ORGANISM="Unknown Unknown, Strain D1" /LENGTH=261 /DNA_ID=CAMNT_0016454521 /DNA_START=204 /DNA_END=989 /DNA_ORIENTATION=-